MSIQFDFTKSLDEQGLKECGHCHGYGSSLQDPIGVNVCTVCGGNGVVSLTKETVHVEHVSRA